MHNFRSSGEYDNDCTTPLTPLCTQPEQVIKGNSKDLPASTPTCAESAKLCCVCRRCQHHPVPHSEWQETHPHQRHQQQRGLLGRLKGKRPPLLAASGDEWWCWQISGPTITQVSALNQSLGWWLIRYPKQGGSWHPEKWAGIHQMNHFVLHLQACKGEDLGKVEFDEEIKKRFKMVYVPNWFSVDLKTGVSPGSNPWWAFF